MSWTVRFNKLPLFSRGDFVWNMVNGLIAAGAEVYGSSNTTLFDNSGPGALNYWSTPAIASTTNAWIRLRFPSVGGVIREMRIQKTSTVRRYTIAWSAGSSYFTFGASASAAPTCQIASDSQLVSTGGSDLEKTFILDGGTLAHDMYMVTGDASEGYSFYACIATKLTDYSMEKLVYLDVVTNSNSIDADPAVYGCDSETNVDLGMSLTSGLFTNLTTGSVSANSCGFYKKGTVDELWVCYPPIIEWGYTTAGNNILGLINDGRTGDLSQNSYGCWRGIYARGNSQGFLNQFGWKGKSRLFRGVSDYAGKFQQNVSRTLVSYGRIVLPWDGKTPIEIGM